MASSSLSARAPRVIGSPPAAGALAIVSLERAAMTTARLSRADDNRALT
jgi:hypothetical protein